MMLRVCGLMALAVAGCFGNTETEFPPGLEPLEPSLAPPTPAPQAEGFSTFGIDGDEKRAYGRGLVAADFATTWAALQAADRLVAACDVDAFVITPNSEPSYVYSFMVHYTVEQFLTIEWDEQWRFGILSDGDGTETPAWAIVRYQKTFGSEFITLIEGSIEVHDLGPGWSEVQFTEHLAAVGGGLSDMFGSMEYRYNHLLAAVHGTAPPVCP